MTMASSWCSMWRVSWEPCDAGRAKRRSRVPSGRMQIDSNMMANAIIDTSFAEAVLLSTVNHAKNPLSNNVGPCISPIEMAYMILHDSRISLRGSVDRSTVC
jgi:hypothetical protein